MKQSIFFAAAVLLMTLTAAAAPWLGDVQTVAADPDNQYEPVVAYNSVHDEYLVVWTSGWPAVDEISGIRVDSQGLPIGSSFRSTSVKLTSRNLLPSSSTPFSKTVTFAIRRSTFSSFIDVSRRSLISFDFSSAASCSWNSILRFSKSATACFAAALG